MCLKFYNRELKAEPCLTYHCMMSSTQWVLNNSYGIWQWMNQHTLISQFVLQCSFRCTKRRFQKSRLRATLSLSKCLMLLQQTIPFLLLYYCLALSDADVSYFLSRSRLRKHLSFEEYKMKVDGGVSPLSEVSTFNYWKLKWLLWCSNIFSCALY